MDCFQFASGMLNKALPMEADWHPAYRMAHISGPGETMDQDVVGQLSKLRLAERPTRVAAGLADMIYQNFAND